MKREAIDIDLVLEEKYPNRKVKVTEFEVPDPAPEPALVGAVVLAPDSGPLRPLKPWPKAKTPQAFLAPSSAAAAPWVPIPGEPDGELYVGPPMRPTRLFETPTGPTPASSPYESLRQRRDRIAAEVQAAFQEVHRVRTESLRRSVQAEHNATLASTARHRAGRMAREAQRYEAQGRNRNAAVPGAADAYEDVHRFRVEALRRAQEAGHGGGAVKQARARAMKLLAEQRRIEAEMAKATRRGASGS